MDQPPNCYACCEQRNFIRLREIRPASGVGRRGCGIAGILTRINAEGLKALRTPGDVR